MSRYFLFTADCHIKGRTWTNSTLLRSDSLKAFEKAIDGACTKSDTIVIGGDLFDSNRPTSNDVVETLSLLTYNFSHIWYIRGNHDSVEPSYLKAIKDTFDDDVITEARELYPTEFHFPMETTTDLHFEDDAELRNYQCYKYPIVGISWDPSDKEVYSKLQQAVENWKMKRAKGQQPDGILYVVMHCSFKHLLGFDGAYQLDLDMVRNICGEEHVNILVGHIHTRSTVVYNSKGAYIHSPGSTYPLSSDKMGEPCFASLIDFVTGKIEDIPTDVRKYVNVNLTDIPDGDVIKWLNENNKRPEKYWLPTFVQVTIPEVYDKPLPALVDPDNGLNYVFKINRTVSTPVVTAQAVNTAYTITDAVREELSNLEEDEEMAIDMAEQLLAADDPVALLDEWLDFWRVRRSTGC
jgi:DNA repair exonuclease SbcCD nuclease subunit